MCLCPVLRSRPGPTALGLRSTEEATYCVQHGIVPPDANRKTLAISKLSRFNHAALTLAPYASCAPRGNATQCSLPAGCQPFRMGVIYPLGIDYMFHFLSLVSHALVSWRDARSCGVRAFRPHQTCHRDPISETPGSGPARSTVRRLRCAQDRTDPVRLAPPAPDDCPPAKRARYPARRGHRRNP